MERSRLKNIIILILALVNIFLLSSLFIRTSQTRAARTRALDELTQLFQSDGVALDASNVPEDLPPSERTVARSIDIEADIAALLLGDDCSVSNEGGGIYTYFSDSAQAFFRANGSFDITGRLSSGDDPERLCETFCSTYGYRDLSTDFSDGGGTATAIQYYNGYPVANASVTFIEQDGYLISVSGVHIPGSDYTQTSAPSLSAITALTRFLEVRRETGAVVSVITDVYLCYQLQSTNAAPMALTPAWCIETDTVNYYVNCSSNEVTHD